MAVGDESNKCRSLDDIVLACCGGRRSELDVAERCTGVLVLAVLVAVDLIDPARELEGGRVIVLMVARSKVVDDVVGGIGKFAG